MRVVTPNETVRRSLRPGGVPPYTSAYLGQPAQFQPGPQTFLVESDEPGATTAPHFHDVDQFQVIVAGGDHFGKKPIKPGSFQYADGFTPYGPIVGNEKGVAFFTIRLACSNGFYPMPGSRDKMPGKAGRNIGGHFDIDSPRPPTGQARREVLAEQPDGVKVTGIRLGQDARTEGFRVKGSAAYVIVMGGGLRVRGETIPPRSIVYFDQGEVCGRLAAGSDGADLLQLEFSAPSERPGSNAATLATRAPGYELPASMRI